MNSHSRISSLPSWLCIGCLTTAATIENDQYGNTEFGFCPRNNAIANSGFRRSRFSTTSRFDGGRMSSNHQGVWRTRFWRNWTHQIVQRLPQSDGKSYASMDIKTLYLLLGSGPEEVDDLCFRTVGKFSPLSPPSHSPVSPPSPSPSPPSPSPPSSRFIEEKKEKNPHMCESIGPRSFWGRCPAPLLNINHEKNLGRARVPPRWPSHAFATIMSCHVNKGFCEGK